MAILFLFLAMLAGGALPFQAGINARLAGYVPSGKPSDRAVL